jgi:hypothetical protein
MLADGSALSGKKNGFRWYGSVENNTTRGPVKSSEPRRVSSAVSGPIGNPDRIPVAARMEHTLQQAAGNLLPQGVPSIQIHSPLGFNRGAWA